MKSYGTSFVDKDTSSSKRKTRKEIREELRNKRDQEKKQQKEVDVEVEEEITLMPAYSEAQFRTVPRQE